MNKKTKAFLIDYLPIIVLAPVIVASGVLAEQAAYKIIPAVVTLFVVLLSSKLYRVAFLLGAANCVLYSIGHMADGLYGSVASTLLISAQLQVASFFLWKRNAYKQATIFRRIRPRWYPLLAAGTAALAAGMLLVSNKAGGANGMIVLDSVIFALGLAITVLLMLAYVEGYALNILSCVLCVAMWGILTVQNIRDVTYLLVALYNVFRTSLALHACQNMYRAQRAGKTGEES